MGILSWIAIGLIVGLWASTISKSHGFRKLTMLLAGVMGAMIGWLNVAFLYQVPGAMYDLNWIVLLAAAVGAVLTVTLLGLLRLKKIQTV
jgi:uncharacterized membrane protein YeaQ/YmgE (transglycosylase-associated protein family)